ncbi:MAG: DUF4330 family protein [Clostridia bacterium]|nr:DUF4330 family protein [Clostridia bacterium]
MMNSNIYEEKKRFNIIDALIILVVLLMILAVIFRSQIISLFSDASTKSDCEIYFTCEQIPNDLTSLITDGATVTWIEADAELGRLTRLTDPVPSDIYEKSDDALILKKSNDTKKFTGKISGSAISNNGCYIDGTDFIAAGMTITVTTGTVQFEALVTDVVFI